MENTSKKQFFRQELFRNYTYEQIEMEINQDYFKTGVSNQFLSLLKINGNKTVVKIVKIKWFYEVGDDDMHESGQILRELLPGLSFTFKEFAEWNN